MSIRNYHELTKHRLDRYAPGPGRLDWANQPDPFRRYSGAPLIELPLQADESTTAWREVHAGEAIAPRPLDRAGIALLLELSLAISAWKSHGGDAWALRCNPSSGNLHPTEGYLLCPRLPDLPGGLYHYAPRAHALELRAAADWENAFGASGFLVGLSSIVWREAWKYGARAWRYCQHDVGHALAALRYAAATLGWQAQLLDSVGDDTLAALLGLTRGEDFAGAEPEEPDALLWVGPEPPRLDIPALLAAQCRWQGRANALSPEHVHWPQLALTQAARKPDTSPASAPALPALPAPAPSTSSARASTLIRQRRSAVDFDGVTGIDRQTFFALLDALLPRAGVPPWDALPWRPRVHPILFVHRVEGLPSGLYALPRSEEGAALLRANLRPDWLWEPAAGAPGHLPLHLLLPTDLRAAARTVSCHQDIAADSAFSLGMLAEFDGPLSTGEWVYRQLFWEAGMLGQALYLEAEAAGLRGTGIGCYFDDAMHELLGLRGTALQDLYHFTVGGPIEDRRLTTLPPYAEREIS